MYRLHLYHLTEASQPKEYSHVLVQTRIYRSAYRLRSHHVLRQPLIAAGGSKQHHASVIRGVFYFGLQMERPCSSRF